MTFHVVDWLPPDFGAVGQHQIIHAGELARRGRRVCVVGLSSKVKKTTREFLQPGDALELKRVPATPYKKEKLSSRLIWSLWADIRLIWEVIRDPRSRGAEVLFTGSPPFMLFFAFSAKWLRGVRLVYRITDFYPEVFIAALGKKPLPIALLERVTWFLRRHVDAFQVLGEDQRQRLLAGGIDPQRIALRRDVAPVKISQDADAAHIPPELQGYEVLLYSGNYGVAHEIETVISGLIRHHAGGKGKFGLWLNACGSGVDPIVSRLKAAGVPVARTEPVPLDRLAGLLISANVLLITLRDGFAGYVLPSKVYACLLADRPILFVGPKSSDVHLLCSQAENVVYQHAAPGDVPGFLAALERLATR